MDIDSRAVGLNIKDIDIRAFGLTSRTKTLGLLAQKQGYILGLLA